MPLPNKFSVDGSDAIADLESFYPANRIPPKVRFGVEEIMERIAERRRLDG